MILTNTILMYMILNGNGGIAGFCLHGFSLISILIN